MVKKLKPTSKDKNLSEKAPPDVSEHDSSWQADQKKRGYYYDDAYGYKKYDPDADEDSDENE